MHHKLNRSRLFPTLCGWVLAGCLASTPISFAQSDSPADSGKIQTEDAAPSDTAVPATRSGREIYLQTLKSIALIENEEGIGTGWILSLEDRLLVTNKHVVSPYEEVKVYFPTYVEGALQVERADLANAKPVRGVVLDSTEEADLAIVQVDKFPEGSVALPISPSSSAPGERVHAIGGLPRGSQGMWKYSTGFVSQVSLGFATGHEIRIMQSNIDVNPGNSGGPVVNDAGQLVGVCQSINPDARDVSYNIDVSEVRKYTDKMLPLIRSQQPDALVELGQRHRQEGRLEAAMRLLTQALRVQPGMGAAKAERGWVFLEMGDKVTALNDFSDAIKADPNLTAAWRGRGRTYREMGKYAEAASDLSTAISCDPQDAALYNERALAQEFGESFELALSDYQRAIQLAPRNTIYLANRADLFIKLSRIAEARKDLEKTLEMNPQYAWATNLMGDTYYREKAYQQSLEYYLRAHELSKDNPRFLADLGEAVQALGNHEAGVEVWSKMIQMENNNAYNYFSRAWSLHRLKRLNESLEDMNVAINLDSNRGDFFKERGEILNELGRTEEGKQDFSQAAKLDPQRYGDLVGADVRTSNRPDFESPVVGTWYVNNTVAGGRLEMTQVFQANGGYQATIIRTVDGQAKQTQENGTYQLDGTNVVFDTNLGKYSMPYRIEDNMFWLRFAFGEQKVWVGSTRRN